MNELKLALQINSEDLVNAKFIDTISLIEGFFREAEGHVDLDTEYSAEGVKRRLRSIREALRSDITNMAASISVISAPLESHS